MGHALIVALNVTRLGSPERCFISSRIPRASCVRRPEPGEVEFLVVVKRMGRVKQCHFYQPWLGMVSLYHRKTMVMTGGWCKWHLFTNIRNNPQWLTINEWPSELWYNGPAEWVILSVELSIFWVDTFDPYPTGWDWLKASQMVGLWHWVYCITLYKNMNRRAPFLFFRAIETLQKFLSLEQCSKPRYSYSIVG